ncbi:signal recognition particle-docking protein FtsY [Methanobrevibacter smithii]|mgnify:CR=1 FL=1|uniref:signal recognition particle-docking protein FtsY n=1 Tax=uncultured Methanobrevibacter sp. TaxID=253161 RepID=UPI0025E763F3|nr:signal recognition particle-docking protein FtsY [Methanobrevibacter smithii]
MFESLKKKFSRTSDKLEEELIEEAQEENNLEEESGKKFSFFSFGKKDKKEEDDFESDVAEIPQEVESIHEEAEETSDDKDEKSGFWSFGKKSDDDNKEPLEEEESAEEIQEEEEPKKSHFWSRNKEEDAEESEEADEKTEEKKSRFWSRSNDEDSEEDEEDEPGGMFSFITAKTISEKHLEDILWELEMGLLEGDVAMEVASAVVDSVKDDLVGRKIKRSNDITEYTYNALRNAVAEIIDIPGKSMTEMIEAKKAQGEPLVVMFVGINGTGKTTTIGKLANYYLKKGYTPVIAAADTFRAGAIEQVNYHADNVGVKLIKHQKGSDPAAVAFDAVEHAKAQGKELVLIDTAGRMQTNTNLMDEMKKIKRVAKPDLVVFVGDALTGNDATHQASKFNEAIDIDGVILTKADADSKGGASLSIGYVIKKPILFLGMGQGYDDIREYDADWMLNQLFSESGEEVTVDEV